jgi:hypothetical protein
MGLDSLLAKLIADLNAYLPHLIPAAAILVLGFFLAWIARLLVSGFVRRADPQADRFAGRATYIGVLLRAQVIVPNTVVLSQIVLKQSTNKAQP